VLLQVCVNGARTPDEHPRLPVRPAELAHEVGRVAALGAGAVHLHVKGGDGRDTLAAEPMAATLRAVRAAAPGLPVGVTTGAWALPDPAARVTNIRRWDVLPDFASVNWHEAGADEVASLLLERGVAVEAGLWHDDAVAAWSASPLRDRCLRVLLELPHGLGPAQTADMADRLLAAVRRAAGDVLPVLLHGEGSSAWPALRHAVERGLVARIGLEDTFVLPDGSPASGNADLVRSALDIIRNERRRHDA
jgi:uncharacterized protein (DUF849 family)